MPLALDFRGETFLPAPPALVWAALADAPALARLAADPASVVPYGPDAADLTVDLDWQRWQGPVPLRLRTWEEDGLAVLHLRGQALGHHGWLELRAQAGQDGGSQSTPLTWHTAGELHGPASLLDPDSTASAIEAALQQALRQLAQELSRRTRLLA